MNPYNGYMGKERLAKLKARHERARQGLPTHPPGPCSICRDPSAIVEPHSEDYSRPHLWDPPANYALCQTCHRHQLHRRFANSVAWEAYKMHVRRGGYGSDLKRPDVAAELGASRKALRGGESVSLRPLRQRDATAGEWWELLRMDAASLTDPKARPRP